MFILQFIHAAFATLYFVDPSGSKEDTAQAVNSWRYEKRMCNCEKPTFVQFFEFLLLFRQFMIQRPSGEQLKKVQSKDVQHCLQQDGYNHRRTRRGVGEGCRPPGLENFQGKLCFSGQAQVAQNS